MVPCTVHVAVFFMILFQYVIVVWPHSCLVGQVLLLNLIPILQMRKPRPGVYMVCPRAYSRGVAELGLGLGLRFFL